MNITPLEEAAYVYEHRGEYDPQGLMDATVSLAARGFFSARQIAAITGQSIRKVLPHVSNKDRKGGRLAPESLPLLVQLQRTRGRGEVNVHLTRDAIDAGNGTSTYMAAALTGIPRRTLQRQYEAAAA